MNEKTDKPEEKKKKLREISDEELKKILAEHEKWLETDGKEGEQAHLPGTDFRGRSLSEKDLRKASLDYSDFSKTYIGGVIFQEALLDGADFRETKIISTKFQEASLDGADFREAVISATNLQKASLLEANFEEAYLFESNFENADLEKANLRKAQMLRNEGLHTANLQDCNFEGATGLKGTEFARADITGAKLPEDIRDFKILKIVEETSKNARKVFLAMLLGCVYSWLTIFTTTDVNLLTNSSSSPLPIIRTPIPIAWFYLTAPILLVGFYLYMHFYLHRLWEGLAGLPARFEDGKRLDERAYPWLLNGLVRRHFDKIKSERSLIARLEEWVSIILAWWVVPITMCSFWLRYIPRHHWTGTSLHITLIILSIAAGIIFYRSHARTLRGVEPGKYRLKKAWRDRRTYQFLAVILTGVVLIVLSNWSINGIRGEGIPKMFEWFGYDVFADFREQDVSTRPDNYWLIDSEDRDYSVIGANLFDADLRQVYAVRAFMNKADLRAAKLQWADLRWAHLEGADLWAARLEGAMLWGAHLDGADLRGARFEWADLRWAHLEGAYLERANFEGADLERANFEGADLRQAILIDAKNLTQEQLDAACGDSLTKLPRGLTIPDCPIRR